MTNSRKNWNCDGDKCELPSGEIRVYPIGGGANLLLCRRCVAHENNYRASRGGEFAGFPLINWFECEVYDA
jgi:hypothetical protein